MSFSFKSIRDLFARAAALLPKRAEKPAPADPGKTNVPYSFLVDLFRFQKEPRYVTEPQKQWTVRQVMGMDVSSRMAYSTNFGDLRTFYADPQQKIKIDREWSPNTIKPKPPAEEVLSSPAIYGSEDASEFGKWLIVVMRDRVTDPGQPMGNAVFGLYGAGTRDNGFKLKKIIVPAIDNANRMTGMREVNLHDRDDVARALTYAKLCASQLLDGHDFTPRQNMQDVMKMDPAQLVRVPWAEKKPEPQPGLR